MISTFEVKWWLRGFCGLQPIPYHSAGRCWTAGRGTFFMLLFIGAICAVLLLFFMLGRWTA